MTVKIIPISLGTHVEIELLDQAGNSECLSFDIVADQDADYSHGFLGESTPMAKAIAGRTIGNRVPYHVGDLRAIRIISVQPSTSSPGEAAAQRRAETQKSIHEAERASAVAFASSFSGKWGDYDPDGISNWEDDKNAKINLPTKREQPPK